MAYSIDLRERVLRYLMEGHGYAETSRIFHVSVDAMKGWQKLQSETGNLEKRPLQRKARIYDDDKVKAYIKEHPQAMLKEIAKEFGGSIAGAGFALKRLNITLKKRYQRTANEMKKNE